MKVQEFVEMYNKNSMMDLNKTLEVVEYIPIAYKREMANMILDGCSHIENGKIKIYSLEKYLLFTISVISVHTNLEFNVLENVEDEEALNLSAVDDFDLLCKNHLLNKIIACFEADYNACQEILNMEITDRIQNNVTVEDELVKLLSSLNDMVNDINDNEDIAKLGKEFIDKLDNETLVQLIDSMPNK